MSVSEPVNETFSSQNPRPTFLEQTMANIGYIRVSTAEQKASLQEDALETAGVTRTFADLGVSGSLASRPQLDAMLEYVRGWRRRCGLAA